MNALTLAFRGARSALSLVGDDQGLYVVCKIYLQRPENAVALLNSAIVSRGLVFTETWAGILGGPAVGEC